jgi:hypothetical protein
MSNNELRPSERAAEAHVSFECGVAYVSAEEHTRSAVELTPNESIRAIAKETGAGYGTVYQAANASSDPNRSNDRKVVGIDGKSYAAQGSATSGLQRRVVDPKPASVPVDVAEIDPWAEFWSYYHWEPKYWGDKWPLVQQLSTLDWRIQFRLLVALYTDFRRDFVLGEQPPSAEEVYRTVDAPRGAAAKFFTFDGLAHDAMADAALPYYRKQGELLIAKEQGLGCEKFVAWLEENEIDERTARQRMELARIEAERDRHVVDAA